MAPKKSKSSETFDGSLAVLPGDSNDVAHSELFIQNGSDWRSLIAEERNYVAGVSVVERSEAQLAKLSAHVSPQFADLISKGRLRLHYILNSYDGSKRHLDTHLGLIESVRNRGGQISVIGGGCVMGAGAKIFIECDKGSRFLLSESELVFLSSDASDPDDHSQDDEALMSSIEEMRVRLLPELSPVYRLRVARIVARILVNAARPVPRAEEEVDDCTITFSGKEALEAGLCKLTKNPLNKFAKLSGTKLEEIGGGLRESLNMMALSNLLGGIYSYRKLNRNQ